MSILSQDINIPGNPNLENYFSNSIVPQLFVDSDMVLRCFTPPAQAYFSLSPEDIGKRLYRVKNKIAHKGLIENIRGVLLVERNKESKIHMKDGRLFHMNIQPIFDLHDEGVNGVVITYLELTGQVTVMKELERLNTQHETLMFALSQDLKKPLSTIVHLSEALMETYKGVDMVSLQNWAERLKRTSQNIKFLIDQITTTPSLTGTTNSLDNMVSFQDAYRDAMSLLREEIQNQEVVTETSFVISEVGFSKNNLRSIIFNLLGNAIKYKDPERHLEIAIKTRRIGQYIVLSVEDNGIGISREDQGKIFNKLARFNTDIEGTGMGLYIIKRMIESTSGKIEVESSLGKGSIFRLYFKSDRPGFEG